MEGLCCDFLWNLYTVCPVLWNLYTVCLVLECELLWFRVVTCSSVRIVFDLVIEH